MDRSRLLQSHESGYDRLIARLGEIPPEALEYKPSSEEWSIREIVIHIADSEVNGYIRCRKIIAENGSDIMVYDQDKWVNELKYDSADIDQALNLFKLLRSSTHNLLLNTPEIIWATHAVSHPESGSMTLDDYLRIYANHIDIHLAQIDRVHDQYKQQHR